MIRPLRPQNTIERSSSNILRDTPASKILTSRCHPRSSVNLPNHCHGNTHPSSSNYVLATPREPDICIASPNPPPPPALAAAFATRQSTISLFSVPHMMMHAKPYTPRTHSPVLPATSCPIPSCSPICSSTSNARDVSTPSMETLNH
jgi:hypothetical protein